MFSLSKLFKIFIKKTFIAFYKENDSFHTQKIIIKKNEIIEKTEKTFENENEFLNFIKSSKIENNQTYISTLIMNYNQGCIDSCSHKKYKEFGINIQNVKILCIDNKFSIFIGLFELKEFEKQVKKYSVDLIYSPYLIIELNKEKTINTLYALITKENIVLNIYKKDYPVYSSIYQFKKDENKSSTDDDVLEDEINIDDIEDIEELDNLEELDDLDELHDLDENVENEDFEENELDKNSEDYHELKHIKEESEIINFIKDSIKDYYDNYSDDFIETIYILKSYEFDTKFLKDIEDELFVNIEIKNVDILSGINSLARKDIKDV